MKVVLAVGLDRGVAGKVLVLKPLQAVDCARLPEICS